MTLAEEINALRDGRVTSRSLVETSLQALNAWKVLNAFVQINPEQAFAAADTADGRRSSQRTLSALDGIPLALKDMFDRPGHCSRFGSRFSRDSADEPAVVVRRLEEAGTIILGALHMAEFALGPTGHNAVFGPCRNPWNLTRVTGGSSSGAAACVAASVVAGSVGSDSGGSIRIPAACCGVVGLKPTQGLVSTAGAMPLAPSLDCIGPLARNAADCAILFRVLAGPDAGGPISSVRPATESGARRSPLGIRLAVPTGAIASDAEPEIAAAVIEAVRQFARLGAKVADARLPDVTALHHLAEVIQQSEAASVHADRLTQNRASYSPAILRRIEAGLSVSASDYVDALNRRAAYRKAFVAETLGDADALVVPVLGFEVPRIDETDDGATGSGAELIARMTRWTRWVNYLGVPALTVPCGFDPNGMPIGLQLVGPPLAEMRLLDIARYFQEHTEWHLRRPPTSVL